MAKELGETGDPKELVPGNSAGVAATLTAMRSYGDALHEAGTGLRRIDTTEGWSGKAGDAFREVFHGQPGKWLEAGDCFHDVANALQTYTATLTWAQGQAADAIRQWNEGQNATTQAQAQHDQAEKQAGHSLPFNDPGEAARHAAQDTLHRARNQLKGAGDAATKAVANAQDKAPEKPGFWSKVGNALEDVGAGLANAAGEFVNDVSSVGNAMLHHPEDVVSTAAGVMAMGLGAGGEVGGLALDATAVGAALGVPAGVVSAGVIASGGAMAAHGMGDLMMHASSDDNVSPMQTDHTGAGGDGYEPTDGFRGSEYSKDEFVEFANGHADDGNPAMDGGPRPSRAEIEAALDHGEPTRPVNQKDPNSRQEQFDYKGVRVIVNYDMPWKTTTYYPGR